MADEKALSAGGRVRRSHMTEHCAHPPYTSSGLPKSVSGFNIEVKPVISVKSTAIGEVDGLVFMVDNRFIPSTLLL
jgi:hypothetical protein